MMAFLPRAVLAALLSLVAVVPAGCNARVSDFATEPGECYSGRIVHDDFVRSGFAADARLWLTLNTGRLSRAQVGALRLSTSDGVLDAAFGAVLPQLRHDSLSLLDFPGGRLRNYLAHARPVQGEAVTVVVSLMENSQVEVRILRPDANPADNVDDALFGVFRLDIDEACPFLPDDEGAP